MDEHKPRVIELPWDEIYEHCTYFKLDPFFVAAIILTESVGNTYAMRFEPNWRWFPKEDKIKFYASLIGSSIDTERMGLATSWGLMQVMGTVARENEFTGWYGRLFEPSEGIYHGCKHLERLRKQFKIKDLKELASAYNAGSPRKEDDGTFENQAYVDKVFRFFEEVYKSHGPFC